jgi:toxin CcdB
VNQYDVFDNPVPRARRAFPFVAIVQHDFANTDRERLVAPLAVLAQLPGTVGRLTPVVKLSGTDHVLLLPQMSPLPLSELRRRKDQLTAYRSEIIRALDLLFLGV